MTRIAMEIFCFNVNGAEINPLVKHEEVGKVNKEIREFYFKDKSIRDFLEGFDKRDERFVFAAMGLLDFDCGEKVVQANCMEKCLLIVATG